MPASALKTTLLADQGAAEAKPADLPEPQIIKLTPPAGAERAAGEGRVRSSGGAHVLGEIRRLASEWYGVAAGDVFGLHISDISGMPTPEALLASCEEIGLDVRYEECGLARLKERDFP